MNRVVWAKLGFCFLVALVAACGGGGGGAAGPGGGDGGGGGGGGGGDGGPSPNDAAFASVAMFVPAGQTSIVVAWSNCIQYTLGTQATATVADAQMTLDSGGNIVFSGTVGTATRAELVRVDFSKTEVPNAFREIEITRTYLQGTLSSSSQIRYDSLDADITLNLAQGPFARSSRFFANASSDYQYVCTPADGTVLPLDPQLVPSANRVVSSLLANASSTVTVSISNSSSQTFLNNVASWSPFTTSTSVIGPHLSFNVLSAELGSGPSLDITTHTPFDYKSLLNTPNEDTRFQESTSLSGGRRFIADLGHLRILLENKLGAPTFIAR
jgi:hypothetical protein